MIGERTAFMVFNLVVAPNVPPPSQILLVLLQGIHLPFLPLLFPSALSTSASVLPSLILMYSFNMSIVRQMGAIIGIELRSLWLQGVGENHGNDLPHLVCEREGGERWMSKVRDEEGEE